MLMKKCQEKKKETLTRNHNRRINHSIAWLLEMWNFVTLSLGLSRELYTTQRLVFLVV